MKFQCPVTSVACLAFALSGVPRLAAQVDLFIAQMADGGGYFSEVSVHNPGGTDTACTFDTFDDQGNPLDLVYDTGAAAASTASVHHHSRALPAATTAPTSSLAFTVPALGTTTLDTAGFGGSNGETLAGSAELRCDSFVVGGATYWLTSGSEFVTGIGVPAVDPITAFRAVGGNEFTAFAFFNPDTANTLHLTVDAYDGGTGGLTDTATIAIDPNGHIAFNALNVLTHLPTGFYGSFLASANGRQFVPLVLGVQNTNANPAGFVLYTVPSLSGAISGIDVKAKTVR